MEDHRYTIRYIDATRARSYSDALLLLLRLASAALLLSNDIRRWVVFEGSVALSDGGFVQLHVDGSKVRGLAPQATALEGIARALVKRGRWPGIVVRRVGREPSCEDCVAAAAFLEADGTCPGCLCLQSGGDEGATFKPWWLLTALMVVHDERCICGRRRREGAEAAGGVSAL